MRGMLVLNGEVGVPGGFPQMDVLFVYGDGDDGDAGVHEDFLLTRLFVWSCAFDRRASLIL